MKKKFLILFLIVSSASINLFAQEVFADSEISQKVRTLKVIDRIQTDLLQSAEEQIVQTETVGDSVYVVTPRKRIFSSKYEFDKAQLKVQYPELVYEDSNGNLSVDYNSFVLLQLLEIQALRKEVEELSDELNALKSTIIK